MAKQIFRLRGVPDDEAEDIRQLLNEHHFEFYETPAGNWGVSMPALWLLDESQEEAARAVIADYQEKRFLTARANYEQLKREGKHATLWTSFRDNPLQFLLYLAGILALVYFSIMPFLEAGS